MERLTVDANTTGPIQFRKLRAVRSGTNNIASAVTFESGAGSVLIVETGADSGKPLQQAMEVAGIKAIRTVPAGMKGGVVGLLGFDAIVLAGVPRWAFNDAQVKDLHAYVQDTGGGLLMAGGPEGFGAGGWIGSTPSRYRSRWIRRPNASSRCPCVDRALLRDATERGGSGGGH